MPGITFAGMEAGTNPVPNRRRYIAGKSMTGTGSVPAATLQAGDFVALSTHSAVSDGSSLIVCRMLLAADKTGSTTAYSTANTVYAGVLGIVDDTIDTNSSGVAVAGSVSNGGVIFPSPSYASSSPLDKDTGRSYINVIVADDNTIFRGKLNTGTASGTLVGKKAGITLSTTSGVTTYTINTAAGDTNDCLEIVGYDVNDNTYVFFKVLPGYQQHKLGNPYSAQ